MSAEFVGASMNTDVEAALSSLIGAINRKTGITNSFDYNHCRDMFEALRQTRAPFDPEEIRVWLVTKGGLLAEDALAVKKMAEKFAKGKTVRRR